MKHQVRIGLLLLVTAIFVALLFFNHDKVSFRLWGELGWDVPLVFLLVLAFIAGALFLVFFSVFGSAAGAMDRRLFQWEPRSRRMAKKWLVRGRDALAGGNEDSARKFFLKAQKRDTRYARAHMEMAKWFRLQGNRAEALDEARKAVSLDPSDPDSLQLLAQYSLEADEPGRAADTLIKLLEIEPKSYKALELLPETLADAGRWEEAIEAQKKLIPRLGERTRPAALETKLGMQTELARSLLKNKPKQGVRTLKGVLKQSPGFIPAAVLLADHLAETGKASSAREILERAFEINPRVVLYEKLSHLEEEDSFEKAQTLALSALEKNPRHHSLRLARARLLFQNGWPEEARDELDKISGPLSASGEILKVFVMRQVAFPDEADEAQKMALEALENDNCCTSCGLRNIAWGPRCPDCGRWNTIISIGQ